MWSPYPDRDMVCHLDWYLVEGMYTRRCRIDHGVYRRVRRMMHRVAMLDWESHPRTRGWDAIVN